MKEYKYKNLIYKEDDFSTCMKYIGNKTEKTLEFHPNTKTIAPAVFFNDTFDNIIFPKDLMKIKFCAFMRSTINTLNIENKTKIQRHCFYDSKINNGIINTGTIPPACFQNSTIGCIEFKNTIDIMEAAFASAKIKKLILPNTLRAIEAYAFEHTVFEEKTFVVPENVKTIKKFALATDSIDTIILPYNLRYLDPLFANRSATIITDKNTFDKFKFLKHYNVKFKDLDFLINEGKSMKEINKIFKDNKDIEI